jgi:ATP-dependent Clp protease ATP-binding subunit ClpA
MERMGRCARAAWDHAIEAHRGAGVVRPGLTTGHLLLGVLLEETCAGGLILGRMGLDLELARRTTQFALLHSRQASGAEERTTTWEGVTHSLAAHQALALAWEEADLYSQTYPIGTEHLLLAVLRVPEGLGFQVLRYFGLTVQTVRATRDQLWELLRTAE